MSVVAPDIRVVVKTPGMAHDNRVLGHEERGLAICSTADRQNRVVNGFSKDARRRALASQRLVEKVMEWLEAFKQLER